MKIFLLVIDQMHSKKLEQERESLITKYVVNDFSHMLEKSDILLYSIALNGRRNHLVLRIEDVMDKPFTIFGRQVRRI